MEQGSRAPRLTTDYTLVLIPSNSHPHVRCPYHSARTTLPVPDDFGTATASLECVAGVDAMVPGSLWAGLEGADTAVLVTPLDMARGMGTDAECSINMIKAAIDGKCRKIKMICPVYRNPHRALATPAGCELDGRPLP